MSYLSLEGLGSAKSRVLCIEMPPSPCSPLSVVRPSLCSRWVVSALWVSDVKADLLRLGRGLPRLCRFRQPKYQAAAGFLVSLRSRRNRREPMHLGAELTH